MKESTFKNKLTGDGVLTPKALEDAIEVYTSQYSKAGELLNIPFESINMEYRNTGFYKFRVGTCEGLWRATKDAYEVLAVVNREKGNGHFKMTMEYFERSCIRDRRKLRLCEVFNPWLYYQSIKYFGYRRKKGTLFTLEKTFRVK